MSQVTAAPAKRLDQRVAPGWASLCANLLRGGGFVVGALLGFLGFLTGGFFLLLTGVIALIAVVGGWWLGGLMQRESWYSARNAQAKSYAITAGFPIALIAFAQIAGPFLTPAPTLAACFSGTPQRGGELHTKLAVDPRIDSMAFSFQVSSLSGGAARWWIEDPSGQSRWSGREQAAGTYLSGPLTPIGGQWTINVISEADTLSYKMAWAGAEPGHQLPDPLSCN